MESLIETLLTFIPIALIIALRIAVSKRNQRQVQERSRLVDVLKTKAVKTTKAPAAPRGYKSAFVFDESANPPIAQWDPSASTKMSIAHTSVEPAIIDRAPMIEHMGAPSPEKVSSLREQPPQKEASFDPLSGLSRLPRLQQALVYAELLGLPKSLREDI